MVLDDERGGQIISCVLELEKKTGAEIEHFLIGRRFVAKTEKSSGPNDRPVIWTL